jgi:subtilase-type serine protease
MFESLRCCRAKRISINALLLTAATTSGARGALLSWNNPAGGSAANSANWLPVQVPTAADDLTFNLAATYTTSFNSTVAASRTHTYRQGTVTLNMLNPHTASAGVTIGSVSPDNATVTLTSGMFTSDASVNLGNGAGSTGILNVNDDDAEFIVGNGADLTVGVNGAATLNITAAGTVQVGDQLIVGSNATSAPTVTISGFSLTPIGTSHLTVLGTGESRIGQGGDATMNINTGAFASFAGDVIIANGSASTSAVTVQTAGLLNARLLVSGDLLIGRNTSATAAGNGTLNINTGGEADVGGGTFLGDPNGGVGLIDLGGGTFNGTQAVTVLAGSTISGNGTINADVANSGTIQAAGGTGLTFNGQLSNTTNNIVGNRLNFGPLGSYFGSGTCLAEITGDAASSISATGPLIMGANSTSGFFYLGSLNIGAHSVTLVDSNQAVLGGVTSINGGTLSCSTGIGNQNGAAIRGKGTLSGNMVNSGIIQPTDPGDAPITIGINGSLTLNPTSEIQIELNGPSNTDRINVSGTASFGGAVRLTLGANYLPTLGEQIILVNAAGGRSGTMANLIHTPVCDQYTIVLVYSSTAAIALVRPSVAVTSPGDVDRDGDHDFDDFVRWAPCMAGPDILVPPPGCDSDDFHFRADLDGPACEDYDVDMKDFWVLQQIIDGT